MYISINSRHPLQYPISLYIATIHYHTPIQEKQLSKLCATLSSLTGRSGHSGAPISRVAGILDYQQVDQSLRGEPIASTSGAGAARRGTGADDNTSDRAPKGIKTSISV